MFFTGFADEAAEDIAGQIRATRELGWTRIEARNIGGRNIHDIPDAEFDAVCGALADAGVTVNCLGSAIANWGKQITDAEDPSPGEARRAAARMRRLGTPHVRIMSYRMMRERAPEDQMAEERFRRLREIVAIFSDAGVTALHENCSNYGGMGASYTLRLLENVPGLRLVFDIGNPVSAPDYDRPAPVPGKPWPRQSAWEFYSRVRDFVDHVHVKDGVFVGVSADGVFDEARYTFPGEGDAGVERIVADLLARGYDGGFSMEPHMAVVHHENPGRTDAEARFANYVEYGRRFMKLMDKVRAGA